MLTEQVSAHCRFLRRRKDMHQIRLRTLFGEVSPLTRKITERTTPELVYLQTKWAALRPYGVTIDLLEEILPIHLSPTSLRRQYEPSRGAL